MTIDEKLRFCRMCTNRQMDAMTGVYCGLTKAKPAFETTCPTFILDKPEADRLVQMEKDMSDADEVGGSFAPEVKGIRKGVLGGIIMIVIAVIWFFAGLSAGIIFFYPPILFCIGVFALIKGLVTGNIAGKRTV